MRRESCCERGSKGISAAVPVGRLDARNREECLIGTRQTGAKCGVEQLGPSRLHPTLACDMSVIMHTLTPPHTHTNTGGLVPWPLPIPIQGRTKELSKLYPSLSKYGRRSRERLMTLSATVPRVSLNSITKRHDHRFWGLAIEGSGRGGF